MPQTRSKGSRSRGTNSAVGASATGAAATGAAASGAGALGFAALLAGAAGLLALGDHRKGVRRPAARCRLGKQDGTGMEELAWPRSPTSSRGASLPQLPRGCASVRWHAGT
jgi:hypothetical protein